MSRMTDRMTVLLIFMSVTAGLPEDVLMAVLCSEMSGLKISTYRMIMSINEMNENMYCSFFLLRFLADIFVFGDQCICRVRRL